MANKLDELRQQLDTQRLVGTIEQWRTGDVLDRGRPAPPACEKHPDWRPTAPTGAPLPPSHMCPHCADEARTKPVGPPVDVVGEQVVTPSAHDLVWRLWQVQNPPKLTAEEEADALERIAHLRDEEDRRNNPDAFRMRGYKPHPSRDDAVAQAFRR